MKIDVVVTVTHHFVPPPGWSRPASRDDLRALEDRIVSKLSDKIAEVTSSVDAAIGRVQSDVATLNAKIAELQALVDSGGASQADMDALESLRAKLDAIDPTSPETLPTT